MNFLVPVSFKHSVFIAVVQLNNREQSGPAKKKKKKKRLLWTDVPHFYWWKLSKDPWEFCRVKRWAYVDRCTDTVDCNNSEITRIDVGDLNISTVWIFSWKEIVQGFCPVNQCVSIDSASKPINQARVNSRSGITMIDADDLSIGIALIFSLRELVQGFCPVNQCFSVDPCPINQSQL